MLFFHNSHKPQPPTNICNHRCLERFKENSLYIKTFWFEGWGYKDNANENANFRLIQKVEQLYMPVVLQTNLLLTTNVWYIHTVWTFL